MDIAHAGVFADWRPDILGHISRYCKIAEHIIDEAARLGRPLDCLEVGCGQVWVLRYIYKALLCKKTDQVRSYTGHDMDPMVLEDFWPAEPNDIHESSWFQLFNGKLVIQDLTVDPHFGPSPAADGRYDIFWTTEVIEHMKPEFVEPWLANAARALRTGGLAYVSTPNSDGSREKLPKDHVYEWGYDELRTLLAKYFEVVRVDGVFVQHPKFERAFRNGPPPGFEPVDEAREYAWKNGVGYVVDLIKQRFDPNWQRIILAMLCPEVANNCAWTLRKR
jgi:SAM-dependent methyltransferase